MNQTLGYPRLQVLPGSYVAIKYLENGHVTLPQTGKPPGSGTVFVFGTTEPDPNEMLTEVLKWTRNCTGGSKRGRLLAAQSFDDNRCYQLNDGPISISRQKAFPNYIANSDIIHEQWCETNIQIPEDLQPNSIFTLYWVWKWPTSIGAVSTLPNGKDEYYTTCSDIEVVVGSLQEGAANPLPGQDPQVNAVANFKERIANVKAQND
ncbi:unnamed protein product [Clonostachys rhizophaga]|uniref:DUF7492 domain-containing protein n=1 Tax=Clonostachys rhizophaga TaxID=160324 RepID=A0A9N9VIH9_9HYPO|nr:unnamed protein product [Clonostachys rhizophaga]